MPPTQDFADTGTDDLQARLDAGVAVVTLNRPARRNALSGEMLTALARVLERAEHDDDVGAVLLTGAGGAFCAGGDVKGMAQSNAGDGDGAGGAAAGAGAAPPTQLDAAIHAQRTMQRATSGRLFTMPKPTLAALPGAAAGAGLSLALACDLRLAAETAVLVTAFARVGVSGDFGGTYFLSKLIGSARARELYYFSQRVDAARALELGLVNFVTKPEELEAKSLQLAHRLAAGPRVAYRYMKENLNRAVSGAEFVDCMDLEATHHVHCMRTDDHAEAARAFVEKREPKFSGR